MMLYGLAILLATGANALVSRSTPTDILNDLKILNSDVQAATNAMYNYDGTIGGVKPVQQRTGNVLDDIKQANTDTVNSAQANDADSKAIVDFINGMLEPSWSGYVNATINQKSRFTKAGTTTIVKQNIAYLKGNVTTLSTNLVLKASSSYKAAASSVSSKVIADINRASAAYP